MQLFCPVTAIPPASVFWEINGGIHVLDKNINETHTTISGIPTVVVTIEQNDNFTEYSCTAINIAGIATRTVNVRTLSKPTRICYMHTHKCNNYSVLVINSANYSGPPTELDADNTIIIGDSTCIPINGSVHINCRTYQSNLVYQWSKDGEVVTNPSPPNILTVTQRGNYTCTATNSASTENATSWIEGVANAFSPKVLSMA